MDVLVTGVNTLSLLNPCLLYYIVQQLPNTEVGFLARISTWALSPSKFFNLNVVELQYSRWGREFRG